MVHSRYRRLAPAALCVLATAAPACGSRPAESAALPGAATTNVSAPPIGDIAHLSAVRLTPRAGHDELVLEFIDAVPGYTVGYVPLPARADGSGFEIPLPGAAALVQVTLTPATGDGWAGGQRSYHGPPAVTADRAAAVTEAKVAGDFEAVLTWVVGLRTRVPFRVHTANGPPRLVVEFQASP